MTTKTIYWILGGVAVAVGGYFAYKHFTKEENTSEAAGGSGTNPNKKRRCVDKCLNKHTDWTVEQCQRSCEPTQVVAPLTKLETFIK